MVFKRLVIAMAALVGLPLTAASDWSQVSTTQLVESASQTVIRHEWSSATDSTAYDLSSCEGLVEARFDPSTGDASADASAEIRMCRNSGDTWQRCRPVMRFEGAHDGTTWYPLNAITPQENYVLTHATASTVGGDTARVEVRCTGRTALSDTGVGIQEYAFANFPIDGNPPLIIGTNCADEACNSAGSPGIRVTLYWDGDSYENVDQTGGVTGLGNPLTADIDGDGTYGLENATHVEADVIGGKFYSSQYASIQAAVNAACAGGTANPVVVVDADASISSPISIHDGAGQCTQLTIEGTSRGTTITASAGITAIDIGADFTTIRGLRITHSGANASNVGIYCEDDGTGCYNTTIEGNYLVGVGNTGIAIHGVGLSVSRVNGNDIINWNQGLFCEDNAGADCNGLEITGNWFKNSATYGINLRDVVSSVMISGNTIEGNQDGILCDDVAGVATVIGNYFENTRYDVVRDNVDTGTTGACGYVLIGNRFPTGSTKNYYENYQATTRTIGFGNYWGSGWDVVYASKRVEWYPQFNPANISATATYDTADSRGTNWLAPDCGSEDGFRMLPGDLCQDTDDGSLWFCKDPDIAEDDANSATSPYFCDDNVELARVNVVQIQTGTNCSSATGSGTFCVDTDDNTLYYGNGSSATAIAGGGGGNVATDAIWDAAGDLAVGSGANTASRLAVGSEGQVLKVVSGLVAWGTDSTGGTPAFSDVGNGTNTTAAMVVGTGSSISATGSGTITATAVPVSGLSGAGTGVTTALGVNVGSAGAFVTNGGALGTPSSGTLTNATGLPIGSGVSGLGTGVATFLGTPSSANLAAAVTGETGSGAAVFATSPTLVTPVIGAATGTSLALTGAATAASFTADPTSTPTVGMKDVDMGGTPDTNASIVANCPTGSTAGGNEDCDLAFNTQAAGALTEAFRIDTTDAGVQTVIFSQPIIADNLGIDFEDSDTNPACAAGDYKIYADLSETKLKKCMNGSATDLDTTGGTPSFDTITGGTNTTAAMLVGAGATLRPTSTGVVEATEVDAAAGAAPTASGAILYDSTANDLEYGDNGVNRVVVNTNEGQTLTNKTLTSPSISSPTITGSASGNNTLPSAMITTERRSMYWGAAGISADGTNCADPTEQVLNSGPKVWSFSCADSGSSVFYGSTVLPDGYDGNPVTFELTVWHGTTETITFAGDFSAQCRGDGDVPDGTWGTAVAADVSITTANQIKQQTTANVTPGGTCVAGDMLFWQYVVDAATFSANAANSKVLGVKMEYVTNVGD